MTAKNLPAEIIKLTEFFSVGFELHPDKHFNLLPVSFFLGKLLFSTVPTFVLYSMLLENCPSNNFAELFSCQHQKQWHIHQINILCYRYLFGRDEEHPILSLSSVNTFQLINQETNVPFKMLIFHLYQRKQKGYLYSNKIKVKFT